MSASIEKSDGPTAFAPYLDAVASVFHPIAGPVANTYSIFHGWKESMGLVQPGTVENLTKEVSRRSRLISYSVVEAVASRSGADLRVLLEVHLANWFFDGARADVSKVVSANPAFQLTHSFSLGSASKPASYNFGAIFANAQVGPVLSGLQ